MVVVERKYPDMFPHLPRPRVPRGTRKMGTWHLSSPFSRCLQPRWYAHLPVGEGEQARKPSYLEERGPRGSRVRDILNAAWVPTSQLRREANFVWPLSPSLSLSPPA